MVEELTEELTALNTLLAELGREPVFVIPEYDPLMHPSVGNPLAIATGCKCYANLDGTSAYLITDDPEIGPRLPFGQKFNSGDRPGWEAKVDLPLVGLAHWGDRR